MNSKKIVAMLTVSQLTCERDHRYLFEDLSFSLGAGELLQVEGGNGAGKTTLLRILGGLYTDYSGSVSWELASQPLYIGHKPGVKDLLSARENLVWLAGLQQVRADVESIDQALTQVGLRGYEDVLCGAMSEGQRKRVNLARLYLLQAQVWILDEPFSAIDRQGVERLEARMQFHIDAGGAIIVISHQPLSGVTSVQSLRLAK
ncbi:MAG: heme exporter protein A [Candidatus Pseudothioglobus sp.]|jgi:heme exporter protein A